MLLSPRKNGLDSLFKEVRVFKGVEEHESTHEGAHKGWLPLQGQTHERFHETSHKWVTGVPTKCPVID